MKLLFLVDASTIYFIREHSRENQIGILKSSLFFTIGFLNFLIFPISLFFSFCMSQFPHFPVPPFLSFPISQCLNFSISQFPNVPGPAGAAQEERHPLLF